MSRPKGPPKKNSGAVPFLDGGVHDRFVVVLEPFFILAQQLALASFNLAALG